MFEMLFVLGGSRVGPSSGNNMSGDRYDVDAELRIWSNYFGCNIDAFEMSRSGSPPPSPEERDAEKVRVKRAEEARVPSSAALTRADVCAGHGDLG